MEKEPGLLVFLLLLSAKLHFALQCFYILILMQQGLRTSFTSSVPPKESYLFFSSLAMFTVTPWRSQTELSRGPPYGLSMLMMACYCKDLKWYAHNGPRERAAAARGAQQNTGLIRVLGVLAWAAAPWGPGETRVELERNYRSPSASSLCRSSWKWGTLMKIEID